MMQAYRTEGNYRSAARLSPAELRAAMANREILQATALAFDTQRQLRFEIGAHFYFLFWRQSVWFVPQILEKRSYREHCFWS